MGFEPTIEQKTAIEAPVLNNLVSAAAGSGKTKVLSERIVNRIKSGDTAIDRLLIVTFTRAAAMQMRDRIAKAIEEEYKKTGLHSLRRQMSMIAGADICTIDSFCIDLVKRNFFRADIPPDFIIADSNEMKILREELLIEVTEEMYAHDDKNFMLLSEGVGNAKNDDDLKKIILKAYMFTRAFADGDKWLDDALACHEEGSEGNNRLYKLIEDEIIDRINELGIMIDNYVKEAEAAGIESYIGVVLGEKERFDRYLRHCTPESLAEGLEQFALSSFTGGKKKNEEGLEREKSYVRALHSDAKDLYKDIKSLYDTYRSEKGISYPKLEALVRCVKRFGELYWAEKLSRKVLEFSDCEYLAYKILDTCDEVCNELRDKYDEIYIDEYQDTNPLQDALFTKLSRKDRGEPNTFIVGDVKQSIYRFRHSDPRVFAEKARAFGSETGSCKMILSKNFRSRREVVDSINCVFKKIMREGTAQIEYNDEHYLRFGATEYIEYNQNKSELYILRDKYDTAEDEIMASEQKETLIAVKRFKQLMDEGFMVSDGKKMRPLRYSDIAVLSSKINNKAEAIMKTFGLMGIPVYCETSQHFFDVPEVQTVVSVLRCVDNPLCDIPLASTMRSPIFSFSENELMEIRTDGRNKPFYENVVNTAKKATKVGRRCKSFLKKLDIWREVAQSVNLERFVTRIIDESGYYSFVGALPGGEMRQANLRRLMNLAADFEKNRFKGLYSFVRYIDKTIEAEGEIEADVCRSEDSVLVASIHKSKGLEFPVCIVIGCGWSFNDKDSHDTLIMNPEYGMAIAEREVGRRIKFKTAEYSAVSATIVRDNHAEQMRLLYVAMTRAKEKLIMIGTTAKFDEKLNEIEMGYQREISDYKIRSMKNYLDYLCCSIDSEHWNVFPVAELPEIEEKSEYDVKDEIEHRIIEEVSYRLSYLYPYDGVRNIPSKMSVSEVKKLSTESEDAHKYFSKSPQKRVPKFMEENVKLSGADRGTAYHRVMELIDFNEKNVQGAIEEFVKKGYMSQKQAECIEIEKIERFLNGSVAQMLRGAKRVMREEPFTIMIDASDVFENGEKEKICIQGTIDCLIETLEGKIVLLDYKTDTYSEKEEMVKRYKKQLELYEVAVFTRFGQKCDKKCLYMFQTGDIIDI
ncbi:MAG: helicase-exonuclease AddAB subunit AddA [Clostridia bacterium]|nr:helicase-exonuclease AddAB subunit AddA [Clostridia bacterium]